MGWGHSKDFFAQTGTELGMASTDLSVGVKEEGLAFEAIEPSSLEALVVLVFETSSGAEGDLYTLEIELETDSEEDFSNDPEILDETELDLEVGDADGEHFVLGVLPARAGGSKEYVRANVTFGEDAGNAGTVAEISAGGVVKTGGIADQIPTEDYDVDGYAIYELNL